LIDKNSLEVTTYREDIGYTDHRHPDSTVFATTLKEDVSRRDFTMNALAYCPERGVIDYFGGADDIDMKIIRCVGDPGCRFNEDALRILRALRFSSTLGFDIEGRTADSIRQNKELLNSVSVERIAIELTKLICGRNAGNVLSEFVDVIAVVIPEILPMIGFNQHNYHHCSDVWQHTIEVTENSEPTRIMRWAAFLHDIGKPDCFSLGEDGVGHFYGHAALSKHKANIIMQRLKFDNATRDRVSELVAYHDLETIPDVKLVRRRLSRFGEDVFRQLLLLQRADVMGKTPEYHYRTQKIEQVQSVMEKIIAEASCFTLKSLAVNGDDMIALELNGKEIGSALKLLLNAVMDEKVPNERVALLEYLERTLI